MTLEPSTLQPARHDEYTTGMAFLMWLSCIFGFCGVHRLYMGKKATGLLYLFTFGLFGIGQLIDALQMRRLVEDANVKHEVLMARAARRGLPMGVQPALPAGPGAAIQTEGDLRVALTKAAAENKGSISVTQGVLATGKTFETVEEALDAMAKSGYVGIDNDPESGVVVYTFRELS